MSLDKPPSRSADRRGEIAAVDNTFAILCGIVGGAAGGALGVMLFGLLLKQGVYAVVAPGMLLGLGCGFAMRRRIAWMGLICLVVGTILTVVTEWWFFPFARDESLGFFLLHLFSLQPIKLVMIALGSLMAGWYGSGRKW